MKVTPFLSLGFRPERKMRRRKNSEVGELVYRQGSMIQWVERDQAVAMSICWLGVS